MADIPSIPDLRVSEDMTSAQMKIARRQWLERYGLWDHANGMPAGLCTIYWDRANKQRVIGYMGGHTVRKAV
jgi:hypothetical protein